MPPDARRIAGHFVANRSRPCAVATDNAPTCRATERPASARAVQLLAHFVLCFLPCSTCSALVRSAIVRKQRICSLTEDIFNELHFLLMLPNCINAAFSDNWRHQGSLVLTFPGSLSLPVNGACRGVRRGSTPPPKPERLVIER